jgi:hypothetical protein
VERSATRRSPEATVATLGFASGYPNLPSKGAGATRKANPVAARARPETAAALYDEDFYAWTQEQAAALRTHFRGDNRIDVEHLAEEIEDLGKSDLHAVESFVEQIIAHLLKLDYSGQQPPRAHWRAEVLNFRQNVDRKITPTIRRKVERKLEKLYENARQLAAVGALVHEPDLARRLPKACPYDWHAIWHRDVLAEAGIDLSGRPTRTGRAGRKRGS